jgi:hypothetical protein
VKPVSETPTDRSDYFALSGTYGTLLGLLAASAGRSQEPIRSAELIPLSAATFALSKLVVHEKIETWLRSPFVEESANGKQPKGRGMRYAVGELLSCTRCMGAWSALALVGLRMHAPRSAQVITSVLAVSAANDFLHTGFSLLCAASNRTSALAEHPLEERAAQPR